jgi:secreted PhoX family phosphatase
VRAKSPTPVIDNSGEEPLSNASTNTHIASLVPHQQQRRALLKGGLSLAVAAFFTGGLSGCGNSANPGTSIRAAKTKRSLLRFPAIAAGREDAVRVPAGYTARAFVPWGTPINGVAPSFHPDASNTAAEQERQVGSHHDGMHFFPLGESGDREGLLVMNHEYVDPNLLHRNGPTLGDQRPTEEVDKEMAGHGVSVLHIAKDANDQWQLVESSPYSRRITARTPTDIRGPARGASKLITRYSLDATRTRGILNNCAHGVTPWNTYLASEENWAGYFVNRDKTMPREHLRYGVSSSNGRYYWERAAADDDLYRRFDASASIGASAAKDFRNEPNNFGWMVEIDPFAPDSVPQKRTALGRFAHEGVVFARAEEGKPVACYSGDDSRHEYIYKFVSAQNYHAATAGGHLLDEGTLYAARFNEDGSGDWLPLDVTDPGFQRKAAAAGVAFADQADVLINARLAADVAGATKMDRPEWGAVHPETDEVYFSLTNNTNRTWFGTDAANPRSHNATGHIIRWREQGHSAATRFDWDIFVLAGEPGTETDGEDPVVLTRDNHFASPDGLHFDPRGVLWIQTDMSGSQREKGPFGNNQVVAADPLTRELRRFLVGPVGCEITGLVITPDMKTLFVNIQHPGEGSEPGHFTSHWPDGGEARPRSATVIVTKDDGGVIGT